MIAIAGCGQEAAAPETSAKAPRATLHDRGADDRTVTLITGDRVTLRDGAPLVTPGPGRAKVHLSMERSDDHVVVIPEDVAPMIAAGQLDRALFDVTLLLASGYGDDKRDDLPLIITHMPDAPRFASRAAAGVVVDRALPALHAASVRQRKANPGAVLASIGGPARLATAGAAPGARIWLDRIRKPLLDHSVPQIGGTAAHARGITGKGVTVAVLDTGIDSTHPDLAGKVVAAEDFIGDGAGVLDQVGHGTHVASIIAGTGAASNGQFAGVAPDALLLNGRVCLEFGCPDSAILAGMSWAAADQHARIVNLSLGSSDTPELDPLEEAVDELSAQFGTLFVVAAGNSGGSGTVESPASADAALAVGAVDRADQLAAFSSRGPRTGDHAIKPEVTAPGVDIVAARASNVPPLGPVVGTAYQALSGTSMATPHVAGAAALLLQQHPDWTGAQLKAQLVATASPNPDLTVFDQGAGRIDIDRGTRQDVAADPPVLSLGIAEFPHEDDPPLVHTVSYHNGGTAPVTLSLSATLSSTASGPTPPGMIQVEPSSITVPPGGTSAATVTVTTRGDLATGLYGGAVIASAGDVRIETPVGVDREIEAHELEVEVLDASGAETDATLLVWPRTGFPSFVNVSGHRTLRLTRDNYALKATVGSGPFTVLVYPRLDLAADTRIVFDARLARPLDVDVGDPRVAVGNISWQFVDFVNGRAVAEAAGDGEQLLSAQLGPDAPPDELIGTAFATLNDDVLGAPRVVYQLVHTERGHLPTGWRATIRPREFATVDARHAGPADAIYFKGALPYVIDPVHGVVGAGIGLSDQYTGPFERTEKFFGTGAVWNDDLLEQRASADPDDSPIDVAEQQMFRDYRAGQRLSELWNQAPFGPAFADFPAPAGSASPLAGAASRTGDQLLLLPSIVADAGSPAHIEFSQFDHQRISLFRDGQLLAEQIDVDPDDAFEVPPEAATYRYEQEIERPTSIFELSPHVTVAWTFRSQHVAGDRPQILPLPTMRFSPALDLQGQSAERVLALPIAFPRPSGAATPPIVRARVEVSFDDGSHWSRVPVQVLGDRGVATVVHPDGAGFVSLRGSAADALGNQVEQTILHAYRFARPAR